MMEKATGSISQQKTTNSRNSGFTLKTNHASTGLQCEIATLQTRFILENEVPKEAKPPLIIAALIALVIAISVEGYHYFGPQAEKPTAPGQRMTVATLVEKEEKDPKSLTPIEQKYYDQLTSGQLAAIKTQIDKQGH